MRRWLVCGSIAMCVAARPAAQSGSEVERALTAVRTKADAGDRVAQFSLGSIVYYGTGDTAQGVEWIRKAALQNYPPAEFQMGQLFDFGFGVPQDDRQALAWYQQAAGHGVTSAQRAVGEFYKTGRVVTADPAEAARWYQRAAEGDDLRAQYELGQLYFDGTGLARDYESAYFWFSVAAGQTPLLDNRKQLVELRNIAAVRMTPVQLSAAVRRAAAWKPPPAR
jgi:TPR repeat protein